jgi:hypothetical protein
MSVQNDRLTMSLGYHAEIVLYGGIAPTGTENLPWNSRIATDSPMVQTDDRATNILVYPRSFIHS